MEVEITRKVALLLSSIRQRMIKMQYNRLSRIDLIQLQEYSVAAVNVHTQPELDNYFMSFSNLFPYEQFAIASFCNDGQNYRLIGLYNHGFSSEREESFKRSRTINDCQVLNISPSLHVDSWHQNSIQHSSSIGADSVRYGVNEGLYGVIKPAKNSVGIICSMAGRDIANNLRHKQLLSCILPHLQLARSTVFNTTSDLSQHKKHIKLTQREYEVLEWLCSGKTNWELSKILNISEHTVKFHITNLSQKLGANNRAHIVALGSEKLGGRL